MPARIAGVNGLLLVDFLRPRTLSSTVLLPGALIGVAAKLETAGVIVLRAEAKALLSFRVLAALSLSGDSSSTRSTSSSRIGDILDPGFLALPAPVLYGQHR